MSRIYVTVRKPHVIMSDIPLPKSSKGRAAKPINPIFGEMQPGQCIVANGPDEAKMLRADLQRYMTHLKAEGQSAKFTTRSVAGMADGKGGICCEGSIGIWCIYPSHKVTAEANQTEAQVA